MNSPLNARIGFFDPSGSDLNVPIVQATKGIERGDLIVFNPGTHVVEVWRFREKKPTRVLSATFPIIRSHTEFQDLVRLMGDVAKLSNIASPAVKVPEGFWAFQYV